MSGSPGCIYLIHFDEGLLIKTMPNGTIVYAKHYLGWSNDHCKRLEAHAAGQGSALMAAVRRAGISWNVVRMWEGDRKDERKMKRRKETPRFCPVCVAEGESARGLLSPGLPEIQLGGSQLEIKKFVKKPVEVEAVQVTQHNGAEIEEWCGTDQVQSYDVAMAPGLTHHITVSTNEGKMKADVGDWIIKEPFPTTDRLFYPYKPDIFEATYEPARTLAERLGDSPEQRAMDSQ